ncbi:16S rRNA (cytidine(1402)-2'-O)-methyltransferase [Aciditerrimonas ferrireducens]|nr:16S rRNA (cytidine(1402)-2'-O)-methyltransferase [Aciditerrimonas ferrireducens]MCK4176264.1 16S rRNA (cytidine(1402)-2'-O)-methyltransferase [Aciditerrimonas ferrireducens]
MSTEPSRPEGLSRPEGRGRLVVVATPIGNLGDLSPRARQALAEATVVCCEDTRRTRALLAASGVAAPRLVSLHRDNERRRIPEVLGWLAQGAEVALVSDAGTPGVSDPGQALVAAAVAAGVPVSAVPGPSAVLCALVVSGLPMDRFCLEGFLPRRGPERRARLAALAVEERTSVLLESARRLPGTLAELGEALGHDRAVVVARELTKLHEEVWRGTLGAAARTFAERAEQGALRGEVVLVLAGAPSGQPTGRVPPSEEDLAAAVAAERARGASPSQAAARAARALGVARRRAYQAALARDPEAAPSRVGPGEAGGNG